MDVKTEVTRALLKVLYRKIMDILSSDESAGDVGHVRDLPQEVLEEYGLENSEIAKVIIGTLETACTIGNPSPEDCEAAYEEVISSVGVQNDNFDNNDVDKLGRIIPALASAVTTIKEDPNRNHCTYRKQSDDYQYTYYGRTSSKLFSCDAAVKLRDAGHITLNIDPELNYRNVTYQPAIPLYQAVGKEGYKAIRGNEQQLIDGLLEIEGKVGIMPRFSQTSGNYLRGVSPWNKDGCVFWKASNNAFGNIAPYTGLRPPTCD